MVCYHWHRENSVYIYAYAHYFCGRTHKELKIKLPLKEKRTAGGVRRRLLPVYFFIPFEFCGMWRYDPHVHTHSTHTYFYFIKKMFILQGSRATKARWESQKQALSGKKLTWPTTSDYRSTNTSDKIRFALEIRLWRENVLSDPF